MLENDKILFLSQLEKDRYYTIEYFYIAFVHNKIKTFPIFSKNNKGVYRVFKDDGSLYKRKRYLIGNYLFKELKLEFVKAKLAELEVQELFK